MTFEERLDRIEKELCRVNALCHEQNKALKSMLCDIDDIYNKFIEINGRQDEHGINIKSIQHGQGRHEMLIARLMALANKGVKSVE